MSRTVLYYFAPQSPWSYLGHARLVDLLARSRREVAVLPVDYGRIFPQSGGLPLNPQPRYFPVDATPSARLITAVAQQDGMAAAMALAGAVLAACWREERDIASDATLAELLEECDLPAERLAESRGADTQARYDAHTQAAMDAGVFGAPTYVIDGELFWGQDRLDFVARKLGIV